MRELARVVSTTTLVIGGLIAAGLVLTTCSESSGRYGDGFDWTAVAIGLGVLLSAAATACVLNLLASIDERLKSAGWKTAAETESEAHAKWEADQRGAADPLAGEGSSPASREAAEAESNAAVGKEWVKWNT